MIVAERDLVVADVALDRVDLDVEASRQRFLAGLETLALEQLREMAEGWPFFANLLADGFSMAAGNYSGTKSEVEDYERLRERERVHIRDIPDGERREVREILRRRGFDGDMLEDATDRITAHEERWIDVMMHEEYGLARVMRSPVKAAGHTFAAFVI